MSKEFEDIAEGVKERAHSIKSWGENVKKGFSEIATGQKIKEQGDKSYIGEVLLTQEGCTIKFFRFGKGAVTRYHLHLRRCSLQNVGEGALLNVNFDVVSHDEDAQSDVIEISGIDVLNPGDIMCDELDSFGQSGHAVINPSEGTKASVHIYDTDVRGEANFKMYETTDDLEKINEKIINCFLNKLDMPIGTKIKLSYELTEAAKEDVKLPDTSRNVTFLHRVIRIHDLPQRRHFDQSNDSDAMKGLLQPGLVEHLKESQSRSHSS